MLTIASSERSGIVRMFSTSAAPVEMVENKKYRSGYGSVMISGGKLIKFTASGRVDYTVDLPRGTALMPTPRSPRKVRPRGRLQKVALGLGVNPALFVQITPGTKKFSGVVAHTSDAFVSDDLVGNFKVVSSSTTDLDAAGDYQSWENTVEIPSGGFVILTKGQSLPSDGADAPVRVPVKILLAGTVRLADVQAALATL